MRTSFTCFIHVVVCKMRFHTSAFFAAMVTIIQEKELGWERDRTVANTLFQIWCEHGQGALTKSTSRQPVFEFVFLPTDLTWSGANQPMVDPSFSYSSIFCFYHQYRRHLLFLDTPLPPRLVSLGWLVRKVNFQCCPPSMLAFKFDFIIWPGLSAGVPSSIWFSLRQMISNWNFSIS